MCHGVQSWCRKPWMAGWSFENIAHGACLFHWNITHDHLRLSARPCIRMSWRGGGALSQVAMWWRRRVQWTGKVWAYEEPTIAAFSTVLFHGQE